MAKMVTPQMTATHKKAAHKKGELTGNSPGREAWKRLKRNRTAVLGMVIIIVLVILALLADVIAPYGYADQDYTAIQLGPFSICSVPIIWAATFSPVVSTAHVIPFPLVLSVLSVRCCSAAPLALPARILAENWISSSCVLWMYFRPYRQP